MLSFYYAHSSFFLRDFFLAISAVTFVVPIRILTLSFVFASFSKLFVLKSPCTYKIHACFWHLSMLQDGDTLSNIAILYPLLYIFMKSFNLRLLRFRPIFLLVVCLKEGKKLLKARSLGIAKNVTLAEYFKGVS